MSDEENLTPVERTIRERRSVRQYRSDAVPRDLILRVLDSARWAPSAVNRQPWHFVVVTQPERRSALAESARIAGIVPRHVARAPVLIALCGDERRSSWYVHDCCLASQNLMLVAKALGLGTCWIGAFDEERVAEVLALPEGVRVVGLITLGYPVHAEQKPTPRLPLQQIVHWEGFGPPGSWGRRAARLGQSGVLSLWRRIGDFLGLGAIKHGIRPDDKG
nr:nitroreductase family protein [Chloroflexota bacterium]